ncbi:MAG: macro domain-containing protein [Chlamydiota bacterium]
MSEIRIQQSAMMQAAPPSFLTRASALLKAIAQKISDFICSRWGVIALGTVFVGACLGVLTGVIFGVISSTLALVLESGEKDSPVFESWTLGWEQVYIGTTKVGVSTGSITELQNRGAIVNAANQSCLGGSGVDGAIHAKAGPALLAECQGLPEVAPGIRCPTGSAVITGSGNLAAQGIPFVIHAVGPVYDAGNAEQSLVLLRSTYLNALNLAHQRGIRTIDFPAISTGVYGFPFADATRAAIRAIELYARLYPGRFDEINLIFLPAQGHKAFGVWKGMNHRPHDGIAGSITGMRG